MDKKTNAVLLWVFIFAYWVYFTLLSLAKFNSYAYYDFDLAVHDLSVWNILHGSIYNSILGIPFLGNHMQPILFLIAPIYLIFPGAATLLVLQTICLGLGALGIYKISKFVLDSNLALVISLMYLLYPGLGYTNLFEFHPSAFAVLFLIFTFYYYQRGNFRIFTVFAILSMLCQENIPLAVIMFGIMAAFERRSLKWVFFPIILGAVYFFVAIKLMAVFNNETIQFSRLYSHIGSTPINAISNILVNPAVITSLIFRKQVLVFLFQLFLPVSFLSLLSPLTLSLALPFFIQHILSQRPSDLSITYHYTAELIPFIFISLAYALRFLSKRKNIRLDSKWPCILLLLVALLTNLLLGPHFGVFKNIFSEYKKNHTDRLKDSFVSKVPSAAGVAATFEFLPHLSNRKSLYSFHHVYYGFYTLSDKQYNLPQDAEYVLIDFNDFLTFQGFYGPDNYLNIRKAILDNHSWQLQDLRDSIALFRKNGGASNAWLCKVFSSSSDAHFNNPAGITVAQAVELLGYNITKVDDAGLLELILYWKCLSATDKDLNMIIDVFDSAGHFVARKIHPIGYRMFPLNSLKPNEYLQERLILDVPKHCIDYGCLIRVVFFEHRSGLFQRLSGSTSDSWTIKFTGEK